jgi:hypothetical protein
MNTRANFSGKERSAPRPTEKERRINQETKIQRGRQEKKF